MIEMTVLSNAQTNPIFRQSLSKEASKHNIELHEFTHLAKSSEQIIAQLNQQLHKNPTGIFLVVSGSRFEFSQALNDVFLSLPLSLFPNFSSALTKNLPPKLSAFTQITAGRLNQAILICIPQMLELIPNLLEILTAIPQLAPQSSKTDTPTDIGIQRAKERGNASTEDSQKTIDSFFHVHEKSNPNPSSPRSQPTPAKSGWKAALSQLQIELTLDYAPLPEELSSIPAAYAVFEQAGEMKYAVDRYGNRFGVYGFPDLKRPSAKVLIVRPGSPYPEIIALHRYPSKVGILPTHHSGYLMSASQGLEQVCMQHTGRTNNGDAIIAIEPRVVYIQRNNDIVRWDGRRESDMGTIRQAIASLVLQWSQR